MVESELIQILKRPVNILMTKLRNLSRRFFDKRQIINLSNFSFEKGFFSYVQRKPFIGDAYCLNAVIYNTHHHNQLTSCVISFRFLDKYDQDIEIDTKRLGLEYSTTLHYYKVLSCSNAFNTFNIFYSAPKKTKKILIKISTINSESKGVFLLSQANIQRIRSRDANLPFVLNQFYEKFSTKFDTTQEQINQFLNECTQHLDMSSNRLLEVLFQQTRWKIPYASRYLAMEILKQEPKADFANNTYYIFNRSGSIKERCAITHDLVARNLLPKDFRSIKCEDELELLNNGAKLDLKENQPQYAPNRSVLYLLHNSLPYNSGGYAARSHGLIKGIASNSTFNIRGFARSGYPTDRQKHISKKLPKDLPAFSVFDGIEYHIGRQDLVKEETATPQYLNTFTDEIVAQAMKHKPFMIHAASFFHNGMAAIQAAKRLGIKSAYEIRGLQEITKLSKEHYWEHTDQYKFFAKLEAQALQQADVSFTITKALRELMISRGVTKEIHVIPNAVDTSKFTPGARHQDIAQSLGIQADESVIGYVGSIVEYEGLDDLLLACRNLVSKNIQFKMLIIGDGGYLNTLKAIAKKLQLKNHVIFTGRVPHNEVHKYISIIDIMPFPRKPYLVCEMVSPLKPFESLAGQKAVIVSSCAALEEIIKDQETGLVFKKADIDDLTDKLLTLIQNPNLRQTLAENGYKWVCANRTWKAVTKIVTDIYEDLYQQYRFEQKK